MARRFLRLESEVLRTLERVLQCTSKAGHIVTRKGHLAIEILMKQADSSEEHATIRSPARHNPFCGTRTHFWGPTEAMQNDDYSGDTEESGDSEVSDDVTPWIQWFCGLKGNEFFCEVDEDFIADEFNLAGLSSQVPYYDYALSLMLDADSPNADLTPEQKEYVESAAELLYGLVHQRFILTAKGLAQMLDKYRSHDFGRCPRVGCNGQACLPVGTSDQPRVSTVKVFCPKCEDLYYPRSYYQGNLDGAFFGTTFPHLLLLTYPAYRPQKCIPDYKPRIFGFKVHPTAYGSDPIRNPAAAAPEVEEA